MSDQPATGTLTGAIPLLPRWGRVSLRINDDDTLSRFLLQFSPSRWEPQGAVVGWVVQSSVEEKAAPRSQSPPFGSVVRETFLMKFD